MNHFTRCDTCGRRAKHVQECKDKGCANDVCEFCAGQVGRCRECLDADGMKFCRRCGQAKEVANFNKSKATNDGLQVYCRDCTRKTWRRYYDDSKYRLLDKKKAKRAQEKRSARREAGAN